MKKTNKKPLRLNVETVRALSEDTMRLVAGGQLPPRLTITCAAGSDCCSYACVTQVGCA